MIEFSMQLKMIFFKQLKALESFPLYISAHLEHTETGADLHLDAHLPGEPR